MTEIGSSEIQNAILEETLDEMDREDIQSECSSYNQCYSKNIKVALQDKLLEDVLEEQDRDVLLEDCLSTNEKYAEKLRYEEKKSKGIEDEETKMYDLYTYYSGIFNKSTSYLKKEFERTNIKTIEDHVRVVEGLIEDGDYSEELQTILQHIKN
jgi:hypothetical protein